METKKYNLDFYKALEIVLNGGAVRGEGFANGVFLRLNKYGQLVIVDVSRYYKEEEKVFIKGISTQKFREVNILTLKELSN